MVTHVDDIKTAEAAGNAAPDAAGLPNSNVSSSSPPNAAVAVRVSNEEADDETTNNVTTNNNTTNNDKVCRFIITKLQGGKGYAKNDFRIDLLQSKHGLYDIAETVFDILGKEKLTHDMIYSHLWGLSFNNKSYKNGWRHQHYTSGEWDRPATSRDIDYGEPRLFSGLEVPLEEGQKGKFGGESASFDFELESITDIDMTTAATATAAAAAAAATATAASKEDVTYYPHVSKVVSQISTKVEDDWVTPTQKSQCIKLRNKWVKFYSGKNGWKEMRHGGDRSFTRAKPSSPTWSRGEMKIMGLLLNSDCKFKKCWTNIMQYAFVNRTESACSMKWYQLKKEDYRLQYIGSGLSDTERISLAKRLAKSMMKVQLETKPKRERHPYENNNIRELREYAQRDLAYENEI